MAKKKFYAIKKSVDKSEKIVAENQIVETWREAEALIKGNNAEYKSFPTLEQAKSYLATNELMHKSEELYPLDALHCYVDGSFNRSIPNYSSSLVCVKDEKLIHYDFGGGSNPEAIEMQQIGGELLGVIKALLFAKKNGYKELVIFHDYKGVCYHTTGYWKRDSKFSDTYYHWMQDFFSKNPELKIHFCKVDAHTGDAFNEIADGLVKKGVGLEPDRIFYEIMDEYGLCI